MEFQACTVIILFNGNLCLCACLCVTPSHPLLLPDLKLIQKHQMLKLHYLLEIFGKESSFPLILFREKKNVFHSDNILQLKFCYVGELFESIG